MPDRLRRIMESLNLTKNSLALQSGIDPANLGRMLEGKQTITVRTIRKIVDAFPQVSYEWLKTGNGDMLGATIDIACNPTDISPTIPELMAIIKSQQETIKSLSDTVSRLTIEK